MTTKKRSSSLGPVTPEDARLERMVLGAIFHDPGSLHEVADLLSSGSFHRHEHRLIWEAMKTLVANDKPIDLVTVGSRLRESGKLDPCGGIAGLTDVADTVFTAANIREHAKVLLGHQKRRMLQRLLQDGLDELDGDPEELVAKVDGRLLAIAEMGSSPLLTTHEQIERMITSDLEVLNGKSLGMSWPVPELTHATRGIRPGRIYLIIALFKTGKSKLVIAAINQLITKEKVPVLFLSLEMSSSQVFHWLAGNACRIDTSLYDSPRISKSQVEETHRWIMEHVGDGQLTVNDRGVQTPETICAEMRRAALRDGVKVVFIDYLQRIVWSEKQSSVADIARGINLIAATAKRLNVAVIALSQVPKSVEKQSPGLLINLGDVKDAAAFAETADCAVAITDPERHKEGPRPERDLRFLVEQRDGSTRLLDIRADLRFGHFQTLSKDEPAHS